MTAAQSAGIDINTSSSSFFRASSRCKPDKLAGAVYCRVFIMFMYSSCTVYRLPIRSNIDAKREGGVSWPSPHSTLFSSGPFPGHQPNPYYGGPYSSW